VPRRGSQAPDGGAAHIPERAGHAGRLRSVGIRYLARKFVDCHCGAATSMETGPFPYEQRVLRVSILLRSSAVGRLGRQSKPPGMTTVFWAVMTGIPSD
jgi:hypothetical protein